MAYNDGGLKAFMAGSDAEAQRLVKLSSGKVVYNSATATDDPVGVTERAADNGEDVTVRLINCPGTFEIEAAGAIAQDAEVYAAADGKVQALPAAAGTYRRIGLAIKAATADGDIIEILPDDHISIVTVT